MKISENPICGIYIITNIINSKYYIGKSIDIKRRWKQHKYGNTKISFSNAIKKYGNKNFNFEILEELKYDVYEKDDIEKNLVLMEQKWLDIKKPYLKENGYNISSISRLNKTDPRGEEFKNKCSKIRIEMNCNGKSVIQYNLNGDFIREWKSAAEIERMLGIRAEYISATCLKKRKKSKGYIWRFKEEKLTDDEIKNVNESKWPLKKVLQMDKNSNPIKIFNSMKEAASSVGSKISSPITHVCKGGSPTYKGFKWKYVN